MKRPWFFWGLVMYISCFARLVGMEYVFIPIFVLMFMFLPAKRILILLIVLRLFVPLDLAANIQGVSRIKRISPLKDDVLVIHRGARYLLTGQKLAEGIYNCSFDLEPFSSKRGPLGFCEKDYYKSLGISARAINWQGTISSHKSYPLTKLRETLYGKGQVFGDYQGLAYSLVFGLKEGLSPSEKELFSSLGLMHLFVVSGLHLGIYFRGILLIINYLKLPRILGEALGLMAVVFFAFLSDFHVSTLRTILVLIIELVAFHRRLKVDSYELMGFVTLCLLTFRPSYASSFSFILGTLSYGILKTSRKNSLLKMYLFMLPLQLLFVSEIKIIYYLANGLLAALMSYILPLLMLGFLFAPLASFSALILRAIMTLLSLLKMSPWAWQFRVLGWFSMIIFYLFIFLNQLTREDEKSYEFWKNKWLLIGLFSVWLLFISFENIYRSQGLHFLDVGQGDASIIVTRDGSSILIDTGRGRAIHEHLQSLGINRLDMVFISHFDDDHSRELANLNYDKLYYPKGSSYPAGYPLEKGDIINYKGVSIEILSPDTLINDDNEDSLVMLVDYMDRKILYTGDVGRGTLATLTSPRVDILKYPHHGSKYSLDEDYYDKLNPSMVILSYGKNRYGHPHREVLDYLQDRFEYFGTGSSGTFHLKEKGFRAY